MADELLRSIGSDPSWAKYNNPHTLKDFNAARQAVTELVQRESDLRCLLSMEMESAKKLLQKELFDKTLAGMAHSLDALLAALAKERRRLVNSHAADVGTK